MRLSWEKWQANICVEGRRRHRPARARPCPPARLPLSAFSSREKNGENHRDFLLHWSNDLYGENIFQAAEIRQSARRTWWRFLFCYVCRMAEAARQRGSLANRVEQVHARHTCKNTRQRQRRRERKTERLEKRKSDCGTLALEWCALTAAAVERSFTTKQIDCASALQKIFWNLTTKVRWSRFERQ